jgi:DHA2 family multidrug resistance protein
MSVAEDLHAAAQRVAPQTPATLTKTDTPAPPPANQNAPRNSSHTPSDDVPLKTWIAVIGATLGAFLAVLNIQIVNSSLADIQGAIGAGIDDGGWVSTSYLVTEIIVIPLSAWFAGIFSMRVYLLVSTILFLVF